MYTIKNTQGQALASFDTIEEARAAIEGTSNVIHYSVEAVAEYCNDTETKPAAELVSEYVVCSVDAGGYDIKTGTYPSIAHCKKAIAELRDSTPPALWGHVSIHARLGDAVGRVNFDGSRVGALVRIA